MCSPALEGKMKKHLFVCILFLISVNVFANAKYEDNNYFFTSDRLKIREGSDLSSKVITVLDRGSCVFLLEKGADATIDERQDNWIKVRTIHKKNSRSKSVEGWVFGGYVVSPEKIVPEFSDEKVKCLLVRQNYIEPEKGTSGEYTHQYVFIEDNNFLVESIMYKTSFSGPNNEIYCYSYERIEDGKKIVYLAYTYEDDGIAAVNIFSVDISDYGNAKTVYEYASANNDRKVRKYISYGLDDFNPSRNQRSPAGKEYVLYKAPDKNSEVLGTLKKDDVFILDVRADNKLKFEADKPGFWVKAATAYDGIPFEKKEFHWIWVE